MPSKRMGTINFTFVIPARDTISHKNTKETIITTSSSFLQSISFLASFHGIPAITIPPILLGANASHCPISFLFEGAHLQIIRKYNKFISVLIKKSVPFPLMSGSVLVLYLAFSSSSPTAQENPVKGGVKAAWTSLTRLSGWQQWWRCRFKHRLALQISTKKIPVTNPSGSFNRRKPLVTHFHLYHWIQPLD